MIFKNNLKSCSNEYKKMIDIKWFRVHLTMTLKNIFSLFNTWKMKKFSVRKAKTTVSKNTAKQTLRITLFIFSTYNFKSNKASMS